MVDEHVREKLALAEFTLETVETFTFIEPVLATLSFGVQMYDLEGRAVTTGEIAGLLGADRQATRRGLKRLKDMNWIVDGGEGWRMGPRDIPADARMHRRALRVSVLERAAARLDGRRPPPFASGPISDAEYLAFCRAFVETMRVSVGPFPTRFDDVYILAAVSVSTYGPTRLRAGKISSMSLIPRTSTGRRLKFLINKGWVSQDGDAYIVAPKFDESALRHRRLEHRIAALRAGATELALARGR